MAIPIHLLPRLKEELSRDIAHGSRPKTQSPPKETEVKTDQEIRALTDSLVNELRQQITHLTQNVAEVRAERDRLLEERQRFQARIGELMIELEAQKRANTDLETSDQRRQSAGKTRNWWQRWKR
jgi:septal ring factor EnvC (AmiA/AmiB activator)